MSDRELETLIEEAVSSWRPRAPDGRILPHPAWADLPEDERRRAFDATLTARALERLLDPRGLSTTGRAVLGRLASRRA